MTIDEFKKELAGLKGNTEILLSINCDGDSYRKLTSVEKGKIEEGDVVSQEVPEVVNKKVIILY
jgi:hypothetical protein